MPVPAAKAADGNVVILSQTEYEMIGSLPCDGKTYFICLESEEYHDSIDVTIHHVSKVKNPAPAQISYWSEKRTLRKDEANQEVRDVSVLRDYLKGYGK